MFTSSACTTPRRTRTSRIRLWCSRTTRGAWKAKGKKVLPILGSVGGKADQEGDREKEKGEGTSATKERADGKGKVRDNGDDEASDVASSHGGDDQDDDVGTGNDD